MFKKYLYPLLVFLFFVVFSCSNPNLTSTGVEKGATESSVSVSTNVSDAYSGSNNDVMLQGFHWLTWKYGTWNIITNNATAIKNGGFTMVWLPPPSKAASSEGYLPTQWRDLNSSNGTQAQLQAALNALNTNGVKPIADIVINHRCGSTNWADFTNPSFSSNNAAVCKDDEWGQGTGAYDSGSGYGMKFLSRIGNIILRTPIYFIVTIDLIPSFY
ncbi:MAG: hypothetical protein A2Z98_13815 [Spirochaetes bacterium GWB1_27_13]|nr:MAG: hypothetical protein A2Z98_13815 [Spirochaetes bacterium GWB1_27_13]